MPKQARHDANEVTATQNIPISLINFQYLTRLFKIAANEVTPVAVFFAAAGVKFVIHYFFCKWF